MLNSGKSTNTHKYGTSEIESHNRWEANLIIQHIFHIDIIVHGYCNDSNPYIFISLPRLADTSTISTGICRIIIWKARSCTIVGNVIEEYHNSCHLKTSDMLRLRTFARRFIHATLHKNETQMWQVFGKWTRLTRKRQVTTVLNDKQCIVVVLREKLYFLFIFPGCHRNLLSYVRPSATSIIYVKFVLVLNISEMIKLQAIIRYNGNIHFTLHYT